MDRPCPTDRIRAALQKHTHDDVHAIAKTHATSAAHGLVWKDDALLFDEAIGHAQLLPTPMPMPATPIFDLASVSKVVSAATLLMHAVSKRLVDLHTPIKDVLPQWSKKGDPNATLLHLLNHSSGLPAWHKYYEEYPFDTHGPDLVRQEQHIRDKIMDTPRVAAKAGTHYEYSDLGYITLCWAIERIFHVQETGYAKLAHDVIFSPLNMKHTRHIDRKRGETPITKNAIATEYCTFRDRIVCGEVHDENTYVLGGVSGHAGVFSTAHDLLKFLRHLYDIDAGHLPKNAIIDRDVLQFCWSTRARGADGHHLGGWDTPSGARTSVGRGFGRHSTVGHLGFTGTSIWMDRARGLIAILLTNRVHPTRENSNILQMRIDFHESIFAPDDLTRTQ